MRLVAHVESADHVCCRYRLRALEPALHAAGHSIGYHPHQRRWWQSLTRNLPAADVCIIQRRLPSARELRDLRRRYPILAFDFDDAVWLRDSYSPKGLHSPRRLARFCAIVRAADLVVAGNEYLARQAARFTSRDRVAIVPTCVDSFRYPTAAHRGGDGLRLVWIGSSSTLQGLERVAPLLDQLGEAVPGVQLKLICDRGMRLNRLPVEHCSWGEATEAAELAAGDIGIAWIPDDDWSRGKCGLKVLQYMAAGLPVVANPVGVHGDMVRHGENGFLADSADEWVEAVRLLAADRDLRRRMGAAGRARAERAYSVGRGARLWLGLLDMLLPRRHAA